MSDGESQQAPLRLTVGEAPLLQEALDGRRQPGWRLGTLHTGFDRKFEMRCTRQRLASRSRQSVTLHAETRTV